MFSLIITIIAIVLVIGLAIATVYYGGSSFTQGKTNAEAARAVNEGQQIEAAISLYKTHHSGQLPSGLNALTQGDATYLKSVPSGKWEFQDDYVVDTSMKEETCLKANTMLGYDMTEVPLCSDATYAGKTICCKTE